MDRPQNTGRPLFSDSTSALGLGDHAGGSSGTICGDGVCRTSEGEDESAEDASISPRRLCKPAIEASVGEGVLLSPVGECGVNRLHNIDIGGPSDMRVENLAEGNPLRSACCEQSKATEVCTPPPSQRAEAELNVGNISDSTSAFGDGHAVSGTNTISEDDSVETSSAKTV